jgi:hypothetical protein
MRKVVWLRFYICIKTGYFAGCQWFIPVILATQEAEIRRLMVQSQLGQIACETLSWKYPTQKWAGRVVQVVECLPSNHEAPSSNLKAKTKTKKLATWRTGYLKGWVCSLVLDHLSCMCKALCLVPRTASIQEELLEQNLDYAFFFIKIIA